MTSPQGAEELELVALVDRSGDVVGAAQRAVVRRDNLLHAATAVLVRSPGGQIYVHLRSPDKDWAPGYHDCAAGGILRHGEDPESAALRELAEELGVEGTTLRPLGTSLYEDDTTRCFEHCFETTWDGPVTHRDREVVWGTWMSPDELAERLADPTWKFVPDTRQLLTRLARARTGDYPTMTGVGG